METEESDRCRAGQTRVKVWTVRRKIWPLWRGGRREELADFGGSTVTVFIELHIPTQLQ